jgi:hypothetical protein
VFHKTIVAVTAAAALGCLPVSISALAATTPATVAAADKQ